MEYFNRLSLTARNVFLFAVCLIGFVLFQSQMPDFDFGQLGVNVTFVGLIITLVQTLKSTIAKEAPGWVFMVVAMVLSTAFGYFSAETKDTTDLIRIAFSYATASAWLYNVVKRVPLLSNLAKDGKAIKEGS